MDTIELLLHPVRLRIIHAMYGGRVLTTSHLRDLLPDVSTPTVYRQVAHLADAGILEIVDEKRIRGAVERRYRLSPGKAVIDADTAAAMSPEQHRQGFAAALAVLLAEFNASLDRGADTSGLFYKQFALWLSPDELTAMVEEIRRSIATRMTNQPSPERARHLLSTILFPAEEPPG